METFFKMALITEVMQRFESHGSITQTMQ